MIKCRNVSLHTVEKEDLEDIFRIIIEDDMGAAFSSTYHELTIQSLVGYLYETSKNSQSKVFVIKKDSKNIGFITLNEIDPIKRSAMIGHLGLEKKYQKATKEAFLGASYAIEAAGALMVFCFEILNLHKLVAHTFGDNDNMDMLYKTGMWKKEGIIRDFIYRNGNWIDRIDWGILRSEYRDYEVYNKLKKFISWGE
jgi:RimJ/RimL family protein N-acetyltransferase